MSIFELYPEGHFRWDFAIYGILFLSALFGLIYYLSADENRRFRNRKAKPYDKL